MSAPRLERAPLRAPLTHDATARVDRLARLLDRAVGIPGTGIRIGLDPLLGLVPGFGDFATGAISLYIILEAARLGVPSTTLVRMLGNVAIDTFGGSVPLVGDLFDVAWKSNTKNVALLQDHVGRPTGARRASKLTIALVALGVVALVVGAVFLTVWLVKGLARLAT